MKKTEALSDQDYEYLQNLAVQRLTSFRWLSASDRDALIEAMPDNDGHIRMCAKGKSGEIVGWLAARDEERRLERVMDCGCGGGVHARCG